MHPRSKTLIIDISQLASENKTKTWIQTTIQQLAYCQEASLPMKTPPWTQMVTLLRKQMRDATVSSWLTKKTWWYCRIRWSAILSGTIGCVTSKTSAVTTRAKTSRTATLFKDQATFPQTRLRDLCCPPFRHLESSLSPTFRMTKNKHYQIKQVLNRSPMEA